MEAGKTAEGSSAIIDAEPGDGHFAGIAFNHQGGGPPLHGLVDEVVAIMIGAAKSDVELAGLDLPRVGADTGQGRYSIGISTTTFENRQTLEVLLQTVGSVKAGFRNGGIIERDAGGSDQLHAFMPLAGDEDD